LSYEPKSRLRVPDITPTSKYFCQSTKLLCANTLNTRPALSISFYTLLPTLLQHCSSVQLQFRTHSH